MKFNSRLLLMLITTVSFMGFSNTTPDPAANSIAIDQVCMYTDNLSIVSVVFDIEDFTFDYSIVKVINHQRPSSLGFKAHNQIAMVKAKTINKKRENYNLRKPRDGLTSDSESENEIKNS